MHVPDIFEVSWVNDREKTGKSNFRIRLSASLKISRIEKLFWMYYFESEKLEEFGKMCFIMDYSAGISDAVFCINNSWIDSSYHGNFHFLRNLLTDWKTQKIYPHAIL